jgi:hypothetical protein
VGVVVALTHPMQEEVLVAVAVDYGKTHCL